MLLVIVVNQLRNVLRPSSKTLKMNACLEKISAHLKSLLDLLGDLGRIPNVKTDGQQELEEVNDGHLLLLARLGAFGLRLALTLLAILFGLVPLRIHSLQQLLDLMLRRHLVMSKENIPYNLYVILVLVQVSFPFSFTYI